MRDLRANIASEAGARQTYEALIKACDDAATKKVLTHLLTREITHAKMFMKALDAMGKLDDPMFGNVPPDDTVKLVFNLSQGGDVRGPWNEEPDFEYIEDPQQGSMLYELMPNMTDFLLLPLIERFAQMLAAQPLFAQMFGAI